VWSTNRDRLQNAYRFCSTCHRTVQHPSNGNRRDRPSATHSNNWTELTRFLHDARIPPDNNRSEAALRIAALWRKNFLFVGNEQAGKNIAGVYALVATCESNGVNPVEYLRDVLLRISKPGTAFDDLLPHRWAAP
jgi:hypothetical protein